MEMAPTVVSHYRLLDRLGEGGMGVVYRAEDLRLGREVAVKLLRTDSSTPSEWLARFEREARLASSLQHPHICTIHELGEHEGQPFIAMERLEGQTIRQLIEAGRIPVYRVLNFARQIADALDAAHRRGIIHRDIKPANLFVTYGPPQDPRLRPGEDDAADPPSATMAAAVPAPSSPTIAAAGAADLTAAGVTVGTAAYMSPEQAHGQPLDARSDLFSFGSVLYEMATGRRAFGGDDLALIAMRIVNGIMVPPRTVDSTMPQDVEAIILKLMANEPKDRYQSAAQLLVDVRAALQQLDPVSGMAPIRTAIPAAASARRSRVRWTVAAAAGVVLLAGVAGYSWIAPRAAALTESDTILIGAFENTTGEPLLDDTMVTALRDRIRQSPFLEIVSDQRIRETLRSMNRNEDDPLVKGVSREVCERLGLKAMLEGSIGRLGTSYVLRLDAIECESGEALAREQGQADASNYQNVLKELGAMSSRMRQKLGESLPSLERFDVPIEQATTPSLNALKAYALGLEERRRGRELESVAFFNQAIELDPEFASAYATLSTVYGSLGEWKRSEEYASKAYKREAKVSERERLFITYQYHDRVTGNQEKAASTLELWKAAYPREWRPVNALGLVHHRMGQHQRAVEELQEALRRGSDQALPLSNLASAYRALGRYDEARTTGERAVALGIETTPTRRLLYQVGMVLGDGSAAAHRAWAKDRPREFDVVSAEAQVAAYEGRLGQSRELYRQAIEMAKARDLQGTASGYAVHLAWTEALYGGKDAAAGVHHALALLQTDPDRPGAVPRFRAPGALALVGSDAEALLVVTGAEGSYPEATFVRTVLGPVTRAAIALRRGRPADALKALEPAAMTELGTVAGLIPSYLRAEAFLSGAFDDAVREYQKVVTNRGVDPFAQVLPLAQLGLARAHARSGKIDAARRAYDELFALWKSAEPDLEPLAAARAEYARLTTPTSLP